MAFLLVRFNVVKSQDSGLVELETWFGIGISFVALVVVYFDFILLDLNDVGEVHLSHIDRHAEFDPAKLVPELESLHCLQFAECHPSHLNEVGIHLDARRRRSREFIAWSKHRTGVARFACCFLFRLWFL